MFVILEEDLFKLPQLTHKIEIGRYDGSLGLDEFIGVSHGHGVMLHEVGYSYGGAPTNASLAVDQDSRASLFGFVNEVEGLFEKLT